MKAFITDFAAYSVHAMTGSLAKQLLDALKREADIIAAKYASNIQADGYTPVEQMTAQVYSFASPMGTQILLSSRAPSPPPEEVSFLAFAAPLLKEESLKNPEIIGLALQQLAYINALRHIETLRDAKRTEELIDAVNALANNFSWGALDLTPTQAYQLFTTPDLTPNDYQQPEKKQSHTEAIIRVTRGPSQGLT
jgi:hypothetical protein